ncbi:hypothetical protein V5097_02175 [Arenibacter palladensis]|uniref:hypothetical protein n=1 Tax=Arenibacter palladensis TaxID=237373 RepID=UPI002FD14CE8
MKEEKLPEPEIFYEIFPVLIDTFHFEDRATLFEVTKDSFRLDSLIEDSLRIVDIARLKAGDKRIGFKPISSFPTGLALWNTDYNFYLSARFSFSNILFNKDKSLGLMHVGYVCGPYDCGEGFLVYLKKEKDGWVIDKIEDTWAM